MMLTWSKGGSASLIALVDLTITLRSSISSPPGSRLEGKLPSGNPLQVKVHGCKREGDSFVLTGRVFNASRAVLDELRG